MKRTLFCDDVKTAIKKAMYSDDELLEIERQIEQGICYLYQSKNGYMVLRGEKDLKELVIVALVGQNIIDECYNFAMKKAAIIGAKRVRFHSRLKGFERIAKSYDFEALETVYYKEV